MREAGETRGELRFEHYGKNGREKCFVRRFCASLAEQGKEFATEVQTACGRADVLCEGTLYEVKAQIVTFQAMNAAIGQLVRYRAALGDSIVKRSVLVTPHPITPDLEYMLNATGIEHEAAPLDMWLAAERDYLSRGEGKVKTRTQARAPRHGRHPHHNVVARPSWRHLIEAEPGILSLAREAARVNLEPNGPNGFCAHLIWYGARDTRRDGMKHRLADLVGWTALGHDPILKTSAAWDVAMAVIYSMLPDCVHEGMCWG